MVFGLHLSVRSHQEGTYKKNTLKQNRDETRRDKPRGHRSTLPESAKTSFRNRLLSKYVARISENQFPEQVYIEVRCPNQRKPVSRTGLLRSTLPESAKTSFRNRFLSKYVARINENHGHDGQSLHQALVCYSEHCCTQLWGNRTWWDLPRRIDWPWSPIIGPRRFGITLDLEVSTDATAAIGICRRRGLGKIRHLATADLWVQDRVRRGHFKLMKVLGSENPADLLTKHISKDVMMRHMERIGISAESGRARSAPTIEHR